LNHKCGIIVRPTGIWFSVTTKLKDAESRFHQAIGSGGAERARFDSLTPIHRLYHNAKGLTLTAFLLPKLVGNNFQRVTGEAAAASALGYHPRHSMGLSEHRSRLGTR